jgi:hypothetical protein
VVAALLLGAKPLLHRWLRDLEERELFAALQLYSSPRSSCRSCPTRTWGLMARSTRFASGGWWC